LLVEAGNRFIAGGLIGSVLLVSSSLLLDNVIYDLLNQTSNFLSGVLGSHVQGNGRNEGASEVVLVNLS